MTSKLTREERVQSLYCLKIGQVLNQSDVESIKMLARMALAAMDSEPVAWAWHHSKQWHITNDEERVRDLVWDGVKVEPLYRHAQPAPVVSADLLHSAASAIEDLLTTKDRTGAGVWFDLPFKLRSAANAQPAPVADEDFESAWERMKDDRFEHNRAWAEKFWNACRSAMLQERQKSAGVSNNCRNSENVQVVQDVSRCSTKAAPALDSSPKTAESRCGNSPVIPDGYVMVPKEPTDEMIAAAMNCDDVLFNSDESFCVQFGNIYEAMIAAAPQPQNEPQNIPEIIPGWIPVSERMPEKNGTYQVWNGEHVGAVSFLFGSFQCLNPEQVTHWMPTAKPPREVNHG